MKKSRKDGRAPHVRTDDCGSGPLELRTRDELYNVAKAAGVRGRGHMLKDQLLAALAAKGAN